MVDTGDMRQEQASRAAVASVKAFLGGPHAQGDGWSFDFGEHLESNWGAVYGGALAAGNTRNRTLCRAGTVAAFAACPDGSVGAERHRVRDSRNASRW